MIDKERLKDVIVNLRKLRLIHNQSEFSEMIGISTGYASQLLSGDRPISKKIVSNIIDAFPELNPGWLSTGEGEMLKNETEPNAPSSNRKLIPFYDDVATIGGCNSLVADTENGSSHVSEWIDTGDWFSDATAAIRHYGDSMVEYPSGSILALKQVLDARLIINGRNYVIETTEFRITKQLQDDGLDYIMAYSSNRETYPDGRQIHSPMKIPKDTVRRMDLVLGCVTKEFGGGVFVDNKDK